MSGISLDGGASNMGVGAAGGAEYSERTKVFELKASDVIAQNAMLLPGQSDMRV